MDDRRDVEPVKPLYPESDCVVKPETGLCPGCGRAKELNPYSGLCDECEDKSWCE